MASQPPVRDPENYSTALDAAADLREIADRVEAHGGYVKFHCQISFRTEEVIQAALLKKQGAKVKAGV